MNLKLIARIESIDFGKMAIKNNLFDYNRKRLEFVYTYMSVMSHENESQNPIDQNIFVKLFLYRPRRPGLE